MGRVAKAMAAVAMGALAAVAPAQASPPYVPGQLVVHAAGSGGPALLKLPSGVDLPSAAAALRSNPNVSYAVPNYVGKASFIPNDPGRGAGWQALQWNFLTDDGLGTPRYGVDAPDAWDNLIAAGAPGAAGIKIAVVDSGIAYRDKGRKFRRSPDFAPGQFAPGRDFVDGDKVPLDLYGHGTHVAGTIAEQVDNGIGVTGLAYGATIIPVRVLDKHGNGSAMAVAKGIRFAAKHGARVINLSFDFPVSLGSRQLPEVRHAILFADRRGALVVASAGNHGRSKMPYPAAGPKVVAVGASTRSGCLAGFSSRGPGLDLVAPGGDAQDAACPPTAAGHPHIFQLTLSPASSPFTRFGLPGGYYGTSQAAPHVSAIAAMIIASGVLGSQPSQAQLLARMQATGTPLPAPFDYVRLVNAAAATAP
jgi:serine protease